MREVEVRFVPRTRLMSYKIMYGIVMYGIVCVAHVKKIKCVHQLSSVSKGRKSHFRIKPDEITD